MKPVQTSPKLALAFAAAVAMGFATKAPAQVIYSDTLLGTVGPSNPSDPLDGTTPDTVDGNAIAPGTIGATWIAASSWQRTQEGSGAYYANTNSGDNAFLPFTPVVGDSYVLSTTLEKPYNQSGQYPIEIGFLESDPVTAGASLAPATRVATLQLNYNDNVAHLSTDGAYSTATTTYDVASLGSDNLNLQINLTAAGPGWTVSVLATDASTDATVFSFASTALLDGADIGYLGFSATNNNSLIEDLSLTEVAAAPEPSTWALIGAGLLGLGMIHRRRTAQGLSA